MIERLPYEFGLDYDWDGWLLDKCADNIDNLSEHTYAYPDLAFDEEKQRLCGCSGSAAIQGPEISQPYRWSIRLLGQVRGENAVAETAQHQIHLR